MTVIIATDLRRSPLAQPLIDTCRQVTDVVIVHTVADQPAVSGCLNLWDMRRHYAAWINTGLRAAGDGPTLVLNDDLILTGHDVRLLLEHAKHADLTVVHNRYKRAVTPMSGWCFAVNGGWRLDEAYGWYFQDDDLWRTVLAAGGRISLVDAKVRHDRNGAPRYPREFAATVVRDRQLYADRWHDGRTKGIAEWISPT